MTQNDANPWQQYWGESYGPESKQLLLKPVFGNLETEEKIGNLIVDVGSGASPVTQLLKAKPARKRICIDIAADNVGSLNDLRIRLDAEKVGQFGSLSRFFGYVELRRFSKSSEWVWELSETKREDYCLQFAQSGKRIVIFRQGSER
jgi:hypothetical protein